MDASFYEDTNMDIPNTFPWKFDENKKPQDF